MNKSAKINKKPVISKQLALIIAVTMLFALLLFLYIFVIRPLSKEDEGGGANTTPIVVMPGEVAGSTNGIYVFEQILSADVLSVKFHNAANSSFGKEYVDWEIYKAEDENFYFKNFEYAPYDQTSLIYLLNSVGNIYINQRNRIETECDDLSKYGLDYENKDIPHYTITSLSGKSHTIYIGDKLTSGSGYYISCADSYTDEATGEVKTRRQVYITSSAATYALGSILDVMNPLLTFPLDTSKDEETGQQKYPLTQFFLYDKTLEIPGAADKEEGEDDEIDYAAAGYKIFIQRRQNVTNNAFIQFDNYSVYETVYPSGYYASSYFDSLITLFTEFKGSSVVALASPMKDDEGKEYYGFTDEVLERYGLYDYRYAMGYVSDNIVSVVTFSELQEGGFYYAYSRVFNTIVMVDAATVDFLEWQQKMYISDSLISINIDSVGEVRIESEKVKETFILEGLLQKLVVTEKSSGKLTNVKQFRELFKSLLQLSLREEVSEEEKATALANGEYLKITVKTRKNEEKGYGEAYRIYRVYKYTTGRCLVTIESIDEKGVSSGENGSYYMLTVRADKLIEDTQKLIAGIEIDANLRA